MTSRHERNKLTAVWVLAPLTAGLLSVTTTWALDHDPTNSNASSPQAVPATSTPTALSASAMRDIEARVATATRRYERARLSLLDVERRIHLTAQQIASLKKKGASNSGSVPVAGGSSVRVPPAGSSAPAPAPAPAPPPVNTTTGAS
jgi:hypothetical protein